MEPVSTREDEQAPGGLDPDWSAIAGSPAFHRFRRARRRLALVTLLPFGVFFFALPILTAFTEALSGLAVGSLTWAYAWAFSLFVVGWIVSVVQERRASRIDRLAHEAVDGTRKAER